MTISQLAAISHNPITGKPLNPLDRRMTANDFRCETAAKEGAWYFSPWTGGPRRPSEVLADPFGYDILGPGDSY